MTLYNKSFIVVFLFATLAAWTDERAFIVLPVTILYHQLTTNNSRKFDWKELSTLTASAIAVITAMTGYMALRLFLTYAYDMRTPGESQFVAVLEDNITTNRFTFGMFTFFEGFWLLFPIMILLTFRNKHYLFLTAVTLQVAVSSIVAISVFDITRSGSYLIPLLFVLIFYISNFINTRQLRLLLLVCVFFSFIFPPINYITTWKMEEMLEQPFLKHLLNQSF